MRITIAIVSLLSISSHQYGRTSNAELLLPSFRFPIISPNRILAMNTTCNATQFNVTLYMEKPFKGLLATKDFTQECRKIGTLHNIVSLTIPTSGCGVRMSVNSTDNDNDNKDNSLYYSVTLVAQQDKYLKQITDLEQVVYCRLRANELSLRSEPMFQALKTEVNQMDAKDIRKGRMRTGWKENNTNDVVDLLEKELENMLQSARAWMEIVSVEDHSNKDRVQVGEQTLLSLKSTLPAGIGWHVIDCIAHDGVGETSQKLLDEIGCPIDEAILPALTITEPRMFGSKHDSVMMMRHQEAVTRFPAFKFPDRDRLHITCGLQLCRGKCQHIDCRDRGMRDSRKLSSKGEPGEILDRLEVFNSVEVLAPGIELEDLRNSDSVSGGDKRTILLHVAGDRAFCVSPNRMAIAFCALGVIFLIAVIVALGSLMRARRSGTRLMPYYTRSLFSSNSSSAGSAYGAGSGSKLLLKESPTMGQTRHWRIL